MEPSKEEILFIDILFCFLKTAAINPLLYANGTIAVERVKTWVNRDQRENCWGDMLKHHLLLLKLVAYLLLSEDYEM